jgi:serine/threonine protein kinase
MNRTRYDGKLADVWSSGVMLYAMLCCRYPFERPEDDDDPKGQHRIVQRIIKCVLEQICHVLLRSLICSCAQNVHALYTSLQCGSIGMGWACVCLKGQ